VAGMIRRTVEWVKSLLPTREIWKPVVGYERRYDVSNLGRVRSLRYPGSACRLRKLPLIMLLRPHSRNRAILIVSLTRDGKRPKKSIASLMLEAFVGPCPAAHVATRIGSKEDNRLDNFHWATHGEASTTKRGKPLTEADVREIRALAERGILQSQIARQFGLSPSTVDRIVRRERWKHID